MRRSGWRRGTRRSRPRWPGRSPAGRARTGIPPRCRSPSGRWEWPPCSWKTPEAALRHLRAAIRAGRRAGAADLVAEAQLRLAFVLVVCGHGRRALREVESALAGTGDGVARARAQAQRAVILNQLGRLDEALPDYHAALSVLRRADDHVSVQRILSNRAVRPGLARRGTAAVGHRGPPRRDVRGAHRAAHHGRAPGRPGSHRPARPRRRDRVEPPAAGGWRGGDAGPGAGPAATRHHLPCGQGRGRRVRQHRDRRRPARGARPVTAWAAARQPAG